MELRGHTSSAGSTGVSYSCVKYERLTPSIDEVTAPKSSDFIVLIFYVYYLTVMRCERNRDQPRTRTGKVFGLYLQKYLELGAHILHAGRTHQYSLLTKYDQVTPNIKLSTTESVRLLRANS